MSAQQSQDPKSIETRGVSNYELIGECVSPVVSEVSVSRLDRNSQNLEIQIGEVHTMLLSCMLDEKAAEPPQGGFLHEVYERDFYAELALDNSVFLVARNTESQVVGVLMAREEPEDGSVSEYWFHSSSYQSKLAVADDDLPEVVFVRYYEIAVHPDYRRSGVGSTLLAELERNFATRAEPVVAFCDVIAGFDGEFSPNHASLGFHVKHGFHLGPRWHYNDDFTVIRGTDHSNWCYSDDIVQGDAASAEIQTSHSSVTYLTLIKLLNPGYKLVENPQDPDNYLVVSRENLYISSSEASCFLEDHDQ